MHNHSPLRHMHEHVFSLVTIVYPIIPYNCMSITPDSCAPLIIIAVVHPQCIWSFTKPITCISVHHIQSQSCILTCISQLCILNTLQLLAISFTCTSIYLFMHNCASLYNAHNHAGCARPLFTFFTLLGIQLCTTICMIIYHRLYFSISTFQQMSLFPKAWKINLQPEVLAKFTSAQIHSSNIVVS